MSIRASDYQASPAVRHRNEARASEGREPCWLCGRPLAAGAAAAVHLGTGGILLADDDTVAEANDQGWFRIGPVSGRYRDAFVLEGDDWDRADALGREIAQERAPEILEAFLREVTNIAASRLQTGAHGAATARLEALRVLGRACADAERDRV